MNSLARSAPTRWCDWWRTPRRVRVLHITSFYEPAYRMGGRAMAAAAMARGQASEGAQVSVFTTNAGIDDENASTHAQDRGGVRVHYFPVRQRSRAFFSWEFLRACAARIQEFDIVHVHGLWSFPDTCGAWAARRAGVRYLLSPHGSLNRWALGYRAYRKRPYWLMMERRTVLGAQCVHFFSEQEAAEGLPWIGDRRAVVVPNAVEVPPLASPEAAAAWRASLGVPVGAPLIGFLGRIHPAKGLDLLIEATAHLHGTHLVIAGPNEEKTRAGLDTQVARLGIGARVHWPGMLDDASRGLLLAAIDVFVLPSHTENFGLAAAEALGAGIPVVVTPGVNLAARIEQSGAGRCVPRDARTLAQALSALLADPAARLSMGAAGRRLVEADFNARAVARRTLALYEECLA